MRAIRARYNPYLQTRHRIEQVTSLLVCMMQLHFCRSALLESWHKEVRNLLADKERMRPSDWLWSVLCVHFSALTPIVEWQEGHLIHQDPYSTNSQTFFSGKGGEGDADSKTAPKNPLFLKWGAG